MRVIALSNGLVYTWLRVDTKSTNLVASHNSADSGKFQPCLLYPGPNYKCQVDGRPRDVAAAATGKNTTFFSVPLHNFN